MEPGAVDSSEAAELTKIAVGAIHCVLDAYGVRAGGPVAHTGELDPTQIVALIGFSGDVLKGTVAIIAPTELVLRTCPPPLREPSFTEREIFDWAGELVNLILGRIKIGLAARGVEVGSGTPRVMLAGELRIERSLETTICSTSISIDDLPLILWLDAVGMRGEPLFVGETCQDVSLAAGEVVLFE
jgi:CheY-specific phosphatase CheX